MSWFQGKKKVKKDSRMEYLITDDISFDVSEAFRHLKATLSVSMPKKTNGEGVTIMMTSACPEDGKTTVAVNLGLMHALSDAKVLLLDADVRKGRVARYFKKRPSLGLSDCLSGQATLEEVTRKTPINDNFFYISCGTHSPRPYELLESSEMKKLLKELKNKYDYILIDTPPLLTLSDALALVPEVDGTVLVCRHEVSYVSDIAKTLNTLNFAKANVLGIVVNDYTTQEGERYKYYNYAEASKEN
jgi:tyrosine-protein kinase Etk/Wzc